MINLGRIYRAAGQEVRSMLLGIDLEKFNEIEATKILEKARKIVTALHVVAEKWTETELMKAYKTGARKAKTALEILGRKQAKPPITDPSLAIKEKAFKVLFSANRSITKTVETYLSVALLAAQELRSAQVQEFSFWEKAEAIESMAAEAVLAGSSRGVLKRKILELLRPLIIEDNLININGRRYNLGKYAEMVADTELAKTQTEATKELCREYENDLVEVSEHGTICDRCLKIEGNVYSLSGTHPRYPALPMKVPAHPRCQHNIHPTSEEALAVRKRWQQ